MIHVVTAMMNPFDSHRVHSKFGVEYVTASTEMYLSIS